MLKPAGEKLLDVLADVEVNDPKVPYVSNTTAEVITNKDEVKKLLRNYQTAYYDAETNTYKYPDSYIYPDGVDFPPQPTAADGEHFGGRVADGDPGKPGHGCGILWIFLVKQVGHDVTSLQYMRPLGATCPAGGGR